MPKKQIEKRIEALERFTVAQQRSFDSAVESALPHETSELELLLSACGADADRRPLTEPEMTARRTYLTALRRECRNRRLSFPSQFDHTCYIHRAMIIIGALTFQLQDFDLARSGFKALEEGQIPSEAELAVIRAMNVQRERLHQLTMGNLQGTA